MKVNERYFVDIGFTTPTGLAGCLSAPRQHGKCARAGLVVVTGNSNTTTRLQPFGVYSGKFGGIEGSQIALIRRIASLSATPQFS